MSFKRESHFYCDVKLNNIELQPHEVVHARVDYFMGNIMAKCELHIRTNRDIVQENSLVEMGIIQIELGMVDENNAIIDKIVTTFFNAKIDDYVFQESAAHGSAYIKLIGIANARRYLGEHVKIQALPSRDKIGLYIPEITAGNGGGTDGTIKIIMHDGIPGKALDKPQYWLHYDTSGIESTNIVLQRDVLPGGDEWVYTPVVKFDDNGAVELNVYDVKLRTQGAGAVADISFKDEEGKYQYAECELDIKGSDYSALYWKRISANYDVEENTYWAWWTKEPSLFPDSAPYTNQTPFDGNNGVQSSYQIFESRERFQHDWYNTNHYHKKYTTQRMQTAATLLALRKINMKVVITQEFVKVFPIDIVNLEYQKLDQDNILQPHPKFTGRWMCTKSSFVYDSQGHTVNTYLTVSRDSWIA